MVQCLPQLSSTQINWFDASISTLFDLKILSQLFFTEVRPLYFILIFHS